jgi:hypothetical protein
LITYEHLWDAIWDAIEEGGMITLLGCEFGGEISLGVDNDVLDLTDLILRGVEGVTLALTDVKIGTGFYFECGTVPIPSNDPVTGSFTWQDDRWVAYEWI